MQQLWLITRTSVAGPVRPLVAAVAGDSVLVLTDRLLAHGAPRRHGLRRGRRRAGRATAATTRPYRTGEVRRVRQKTVRIRHQT